ncbi:MAG: UvrD-helicase domain-containing protein, partial [Hydrogenovibrio sp.]|nr:UvrD-helicase domain-containing protein [Hydrogenovibrio sp.]
MAKFTSPATLFEDIEPDLSLQDGQARFDAIHPFHSFIVQAPAGSGKTALLTQRFLALLSQVETPEQIIAMTFTKKAAAEMQERIFQALQFGASPLKPDSGIFERNTWYLAKAALENSHRREWQLLQNPHRLRIRTLDSMNSYLVQQMPLLSRFGGQSELVEQP